MERPYRSLSMSADDRQPLRNTPAASRVIRNHNNRFGCVLSSLYDFWISKAAGTTSRRDSYSVLTFEGEGSVRHLAAEYRRGSLLVQVIFANDTASSPDELLLRLMSIRPDGWYTNFAGALSTAQNVMETHWSQDRYTRESPHMYEAT